MRPQFDFEITHQEIQDEHILTFTPSGTSEGYAPQQMVISNEQWDALRFHFIRACNDEETAQSGIETSKLAWL